MGEYYEFYRPWDMKLLAGGKYAGMPFNQNNCPPVMEVYDTDDKYSIDYSRTGLMDRKMAREFQKVMEINPNFFTDLMDENETDSLIYRIQ